MNTSPVDFFIYVRKSTDESNRQVLSIQAQLFELNEFAKREGLNVVRVFGESRTAKAPGRPQFNLMLSEIENGKAHGILAWHPDRLARNSVDGGRIVYLVARAFSFGLGNSAATEIAKEVQKNRKISRAGGNLFGIVFGLFTKMPLHMIFVSLNIVKF
jgi:hypothetical protein